MISSDQQPFFRPNQTWKLNLFHLSQESKEQNFDVDKIHNKLVFSPEYNKLNRFSSSFMDSRSLRLDLCLFKAQSEIQLLGNERNQKSRFTNQN